MPFIVASFLHLSGAIDATSWYSFITILVLPINCIVNPVLYDRYTTNYIHVKFEKYLSNIRTRVKLRRKQGEEAMLRQRNINLGRLQHNEMQPIQTDERKSRSEQEKKCDMTAEVTD
jgi:hypothetical protein